MLAFWGWGWDAVEAAPARIEAIRRRHAREGLVVIGLGAEPPRWTPRRLCETPPEIRTIADAGRIRDDYHARGQVVVVISRDGVVRDWIQNFEVDTEWDIESSVVSALREPGPVAAARRLRGTERRPHTLRPPKSVVSPCRSDQGFQL